MDNGLETLEDSHEKRREDHRGGGRAGKLPGGRTSSQCSWEMTGSLQWDWEHGPSSWLTPSQGCRGETPMGGGDTGQMTSKSLSKTKVLWILEPKNRDAEAVLAGEKGQLGCRPLGSWQEVGVRASSWRSLRDQLRRWGLK